MMCNLSKIFSVETLKKKIIFPPNKIRVSSRHQLKIRKRGESRKPIAKQKEKKKKKTTTTRENKRGEKIDNSKNQNILVTKLMIKQQLDRNVAIYLKLIYKYKIISPNLLDITLKS